MGKENCFGFGNVTLFSVVIPSLARALSRVKLACSAVFLLIASTALGIEESYEIMFPGDDPEKMVLAIKEILKGIEENSSQLRNLWVTGDLFLGSGDGVPPMQNDASTLRRFPFQLIVKNGNRRYEQEVLDMPGGKEQSNVITIMNDRGIYRLGGKYLIVIPPRGPFIDEHEWQSQTGSFTDFQLAYDFFRGRDAPLPAWLDSCLARVENREPHLPALMVKYTRKGSLITIEILPPPTVDAPDFSMVQVDASKGYTLTRAAQQQGKRGGPVFDRVARRAECEEIAPSVFYLKKAWYDMECDSKVQSTGWRHSELEVKSVKFGDFACDSSLFDPDKLPVPPDAEILDFRSGNMVKYSYKQGPLSQEDHAHKLALSEKIAILKMLSQQTKANYDGIQTWTGHYRSQTQAWIVGDYAESLCREAKISVSANHVPLTKVSSATIRFAVDIAGNALFTAFEEDSASEFRLRTGELLTLPDIVATNVASIVTPEHFLHFMPTMAQTTLDGYPQVPLDGGAGRIAFREPRDNAIRSPWKGFDPRLFFGFDQLPIHTWLGNFCDFIPKATSEDKTEIDGLLDVEEEHSDGTPLYKIVFKGNEFRLDGKVGFNLVASCRRESGGRLREQRTWEYRKVMDTFIPVKLHLTTYRDDGSTNYEQVMTMGEFSVNKPIAPAVFTYDQFGLKNGERVLDQIQGMLFLYQDGKLVPAKDSPPPQGQNSNMN